MSLQTNEGRARLGFIGGGKLAGSVIRGLVRGNFCPAEQIFVSEPMSETRASLRDEAGVCVSAENADAAGKGDVVLIGVKPGVVLAAIGEIASLIEGKLVVSLAAGVRTSSMEDKAGARFMRAMTNLPAAVCAAATAIARGSRTTDEDIETARQIFSAIGTVVEVDEDQIDAVTALAGSGPAFVYSVIEALASGGAKCGLAADVSLGLATQTVLGAAQLGLETKLPPETLRSRVTTPGGTTAAGLAVMEKAGASEALSAAVEAAAARAKELMQEGK